MCEFLTHCFIFISQLYVHVPKLKFCPDPPPDARCSLSSLNLHPLTSGNLLMWYIFESRFQLLSMKACSRTLSLFCTGEAFLMLNAGHSLKTSLVSEIRGGCYTLLKGFSYICAFSSQVYCFLVPAREHWQALPNVCFPNFI